MLTNASRRHVFADIKPYICTFSDCKDALKTFPTRAMWETHEFDQHRFDTSLCCSVCRCDVPTEDREAHVQAAHGLHLKEKPLAISLGLHEQRRPHEAALLSCPLCLSVPGKSRRDFVTHVGKHMESIALTALPRANDSDSESDSGIESATTTSDGHLTTREYPNSGHQGKNVKEESVAEANYKKHLHLAQVLQTQGKLVEAEEMYERALQGREKLLGTEHPLTLDIVNSLGTLYGKQGKLNLAEQIYNRVLQSREKALGIEHPLTLDTVNNLGTLYGKQGKLTWLSRYIIGCCKAGRRRLV